MSNITAARGGDKWFNLLLYISSRHCLNFGNFTHCHIKLFNNRRTKFYSDIFYSRKSRVATRDRENSIHFSWKTTKKDTSSNIKKDKIKLLLSRFVDERDLPGNCFTLNVCFVTDVGILWFRCLCRCCRHPKLWWWSIQHCWWNIGAACRRFSLWFVFIDENAIIIIARRFIIVFLGSF